MTQTLTLWPFDPGSSSYGAAVTKSLADWGIADGISGARKQNLTPGECELTFPGGALAASTFTHRSKVKLVIDGRNFFLGYVDNDPARRKTGSEDEYSITIRDSIWVLGKLPFLQPIQVLTGVSGTPPAPTYTTQYWTHFNLNLPVTPNFQNSGFMQSVYYTPTLLDSRDQIKQVLDQAIAKGVWIDYDDADIFACPVLPSSVQNITMLDAIRYQIEDYDVVAWLDMSGDTPMFHCKQRKDLPGYSRALVAAGGRYNAATDCTGLSVKRRDDLKASFVRIDFEQQVTVGSAVSARITSAVYPDPQPADFFNALITVVPVKPINAAQHSQMIQTAVIDENSLDWWKQRIPAMDDTLTGSNALVEYDGLDFTPGIAPLRQSTLPNMLVKGQIHAWMGGSWEKDKIMASFTYHRKASATRPGTKIKAHTKHTRVTATDLDFPALTEVVFTDFTSLGEDITPFLSMPQLIYDDLNPAGGHGEGSVPVFEDPFTGNSAPGFAFSVTGSIAAHAAMNELVQDIGFRVRTGGIDWTLNLGPNKTLNPQQIQHRLRAARVRYVSSVGFDINGAGIKVKHPEVTADEYLASAEPDVSEENFNEDDGTGNFGNVQISGNAGEPFVQSGLMKSDGSYDPAHPRWVLSAQDIIAGRAL